MINGEVLSGEMVGVDQYSAISFPMLQTCLDTRDAISGALS